MDMFIHFREAHLEVVLNMTAEEFLLCFRRFTPGEDHLMLLSATMLCSLRL